ncbi:TM2 domain-containing protein [Chloroflexota bacterium]
MNAIHSVMLYRCLILAVTLLSFFYGHIGVHWFFLGKIGTGILIIVPLGGLGIRALIDYIMAVSDSTKDKDGNPENTWECHW